MIRLYNSMTRTKEDFVPLNPPAVKMYVCGPTVYDFLHIGNFRGPVIYNLLRNWLEHRGYKVSFALNFTDVDDKIINRANQQGIAPNELAERFVQEYKQDFVNLGLRLHDINPKVSESMDDITKMVQSLIEKDKAYVVDGDVLYAVDNFKDYGKLSGRVTEDQEAGSRVEVDKRKRNPADFALWKSAKPGEPSWPSPWGAGRPGWHIECSAMICKHFGDQIDIHGGGMDLLFPHHENEIAQSEGVTGKSFVKYWVHTNMLNFSGQKMSKSVGNIVSLRSFITDYNPEIYKMMILTTHYRSLNEFGEEAIERAIASLGKFYSALSTAEEILAEMNLGAGIKNLAVDPKWKQKSEELWIKVGESLDDDLNTPSVFAALYDFLHLFNSQIKRGMKVNEAVAAKAFLFSDFVKQVGSMMALFQEPASQYLRLLDDMLLQKLNVQRADVDAIVEERSKARFAKDFAKSDELRAKLTAMKISVSDTPTGSVWEVTK